MSNPNGPEAVAECVKPIEQLKSDLSHHKSFPTCDEAQSTSYVRASTSVTYGQCPVGTTALGKGELAVLPNGTLDVVPSVGIGEGDVSAESSSGSNVPPPKVCVGTCVGSYTSFEIDEGAAAVGIYETVTTLPPQLNSGSYEVVVGNSVYRRVQLGQ